MSGQKQKRSRGLIFTNKGLQKLELTILSRESREKNGKKYTLEELSEITGLAYNTVFKVLKRQKGVDKRTLVKFFMAFDLELNSDDYYALPNSPLKRSSKCTVEWVNCSDAIDVCNFYGRTAEIATLKNRIVEDCCRLVAIYGMGGIGKTTLSVKLIKQIENKFDYVSYISLKKPPLLEKVLADLIQFLSNKKESEMKLSNSIKGSFLELINYLRLHRCLIVLDEVEIIMQTGVYSGCYQKIYKNYGQLIRYMGEVSHQSCFLLITRELPKEVAIIEGKTLPIYSLKLNGLRQFEGQKIFQEQNLSGTDLQQNILIESYSGNPLALKIVAEKIIATSNGNIYEFLQQDEPLCSGIQKLLAQSYKRLSILEKKVCQQLVISLKPISISYLQKELLPSILFTEIIVSLESLIRRSLVIFKNGYFVCEPLLHKYLVQDNRDL
jgi:hypothetical protein